MNDSTETVFDIIRHGEPVGGEKYRGQSDDPLSDYGWQQMREATELIQDSWDMIITSPLLRCSEFAMEVNRETNTTLKVDERLMEMGFGDWEGKSKDEISEADRQAFREDPVNNAPANAEGLFEFYDRVVTAWDSINKGLKGKNVLVVTHAGVLRVLITHIEGLKISEMFQLKFPYASITRIRVAYTDSGVEQTVENRELF
jgi:alpha-ribazole phosphatase/probable phosphoglycerate mutase